MRLVDLISVVVDDSMARWIWILSILGLQVQVQDMAKLFDFLVSNNMKFFNIFLHISKLYNNYYLLLRCDKRSIKNFSIITYNSKVYKSCVIYLKLRSIIKKIIFFA